MNRIKEIEKQIRELEEKKLEVMLEIGLAYRCRKCGKIVEKPGHDEKYTEQQLCFNCWSKEMNKRIREAWIEFFKDAKIIDVEPTGNPYDIDNFRALTIEKNGKKYRIEVDVYGDPATMYVIDIDTGYIVDIIDYKEVI